MINNIIKLVFLTLGKIVIINHLQNLRGGIFILPNHMVVAEFSGEM